MHASVHEFTEKYITEGMVKGNRVVEVGSLDVNGSVREHIEALNPSEYLGIDFVDGDGVDRVLNAEELEKEYGENSFDVVISTEMLEHAANWRECVNNMKSICKEWLIITTRGPGFPYHPFPTDEWRYTTEDFKKIFKDFDTVYLEDDPQDPGVFFIGKKTKRKRVDLSGVELKRPIS